MHISTNIVMFEAPNFWEATNQNGPEGELPNEKGVERETPGGDCDKEEVSPWGESWTT